MIFQKNLTFIILSNKLFWTNLLVSSTLSKKYFKIYSNDVFNFFTVFSIYNFFKKIISFINKF